MPNFPASLDGLANPTPTTLRNDPGFSLAGQIATLNDIAEALEAKLGIGASTPGAVAGVLRRTAAGASAWGQAVDADVAAAGTANIAINKLAHVGAGNVLRSDGTQNVAGKVQTADLAAGAAGLLSSVTFGAQTTGVTTTGGMAASNLPGVVTTGKPCLVICTLVGLGVNAATSGSHVEIWMDGAFQKDVVNQVTGAGVYVTVAAFAALTPSAATHTFYLSWYTSSGCTFTCNSGVLAVVELRGG